MWRMFTFNLDTLRNGNILWSGVGADDMKIAFFHSSLEERIWMKQLEAFKISGSKDNLCLFEKSLDGLKEAPRST